jgi:hypothetical protein
MPSNRVKFRKTHKRKYLRGGNTNGCLIPNYFIPMNPDVSKLGFAANTSEFPRLIGGTRRRRRVVGKKRHRRGGSVCNKQNGGFFGPSGLSTLDYNINMTKALYSGQPLSSVPSPYPFS